jgi:hypothetical protein
MLTDNEIQTEAVEVLNAARPLAPSRVVLRRGPLTDVVAFGAGDKPLATAEHDGLNWEIFRVGVGDSDAWNVEGCPEAAGRSLIEAAASVLAFGVG